MNVKFINEAFKELHDAINYYEIQQSGLGVRFNDEFEKYVKWIKRNPKIPMLRKGGYRRVNLKVFPFFIAYIIRKDIIWILAISHSYRKPNYWIKRL